MDIQAFTQQLIKLMHSKIDNTETINQMITQFDHDIKFKEFKAVLNE